MSTNLVSRWLTPVEAAEYARVPVGTVRRWIDAGYIRPVVTRDKAELRGKGANGYVIDARDIDAYMETRKRSPADETVGAKPKGCPRRPESPSVEGSAAAAFLAKYRKGGG